MVGVTGHTIPDINVTVKQAGEIHSVQCYNLFKNRLIILLSVPGAFMPVCTRKHISGFINEADHLHKFCDEIFCISTNDIFVLLAWEEHLQCQGKITMLSDGNGAIAQEMMLTADMTELNAGTRFQRSSMFVKNGVVKWVGLDVPSEVENSSVTNMLTHLTGLNHSG